MSLETDRQINSYENAEEASIVERQLEFYRRGEAGCLFAAHASLNPDRFEWKFSVTRPESSRLEEIIRLAMTDNRISTQSIILPEVTTVDKLRVFLEILGNTKYCLLEQEEESFESICLGYRMKIGELKSLVTGFGNFDFLPKTRQAPYTEITFRSKPRPDYEYVMKEAPPDTIHLADMHMKGMSKPQLQALWDGSFRNTERVIGHKPDLRSAARTTFAIPIKLWK